MPTAAVIGCGDVSSVHFEAIAANPKIDLVAVCDTDPKQLAVTVAALDVAGFTDHRRLIEEMRPDVVHVCTPHHQHVSVAVDCLERGTNVIIEKPLAHTVAEGQRLVVWRSTLPPRPPCASRTGTTPPRRRCTSC